MSANHLRTTVLPVQRGVTEEEYEELVDRIHSVISTTIPPGSTVLVVSKGDDRLVEMEAWRGWHFPQDPDGTYAGYYPAESEGAIKHLEELVESGADYLVMPSTTFWWPDHYGEFARHLAAHYPLLVRLDDTCLIYELRESGDRLAAFLDNLLPPAAAVAVVTGGNARLLELERPASHFPADEDGSWDPDWRANDSDVAAALDELRADGLRFLIVPADASGWLERHPDFLTLLRARSHEVANRPALCSIFDLERPTAAARADTEIDRTRDEKAAQGEGVATRLKRALWRGRSQHG